MDISIFLCVHLDKHLAPCGMRSVYGLRLSSQLHSAVSGWAGTARGAHQLAGLSRAAHHRAAERQDTGEPQLGTCTPAIQLHQTRED